MTAFTITSLKKSVAFRTCVGHMTTVDLSAKEAKIRWYGRVSISTVMLTAAQVMVVTKWITPSAHQHYLYDLTIMRNELHLYAI